ncbi:MAG: TIGR02281 family clan AA aspartic protease [Alphaproteobacteria bacterium]|nr:TIGR02281 family clan AA aspartic protease [Alphaproteobacteria bacterium]
MTGGERPLWPWVLAAAVALGVLVAYLSVEFPDALDDENARLRLVIGVLWAVLMLSAFIARARQGPIAHLVRYAAAWLLIGLGLLTVYSFRAELFGWRDRVVAELVPQRGLPARGQGDTGEPGSQYGNSISFRSREGGHYVVEAHVNGAPIRFMVDTGASDVVLTPADARRVGLNPNTLDYSRRYNTANGVVAGAPVVLDRVRVGPIEIENVRASVNKAEMAGSLLGMSFLGRLSGYEVQNGILTLKQ